MSIIYFLTHCQQPYDATEQEVQKVFEVAGPVKSFRHVFDRDNNKAKGFGE